MWIWYRNGSLGTVIDKDSENRIFVEKYANIIYNILYKMRKETFGGEYTFFIHFLCCLHFLQTNSI